MYRKISAQMSIMIRQKGANICFLTIYLCVILNYIKNLFMSRGYQKGTLGNIVSFSILSPGNEFGYYILTFLPFLIVLPAGFSIAKEKKTNVDIYQMNRCGGITQYYITKICAAFITTFVVFSVPFLGELLLNICSFMEWTSKEDMSLCMAYSISEGIKVPTVFNSSQIMFCFLHIIMSGVIISCFSMVPLACSCIYSKYSAYLLIPLYLLFSFFNKTKFKFFGRKISHSYYDYFWWIMDDKNGVEIMPFMLLALMAAGLSVIFIIVHAKRGE